MPEGEGFLQRAFEEIFGRTGERDMSLAHARTGRVIDIEQTRIEPD
jgi:hypothetical protein